MPKRTASEAERFFHERIPLTRAMGVRVVGSEDAGLTIEAPVTPNHNHLHTAFGGSINAIATLAGYGFLWLALRDDAAQIVVACSSIRFFRPVKTTIRARCDLPPFELLERFHSLLEAKGKARIALTVRVSDDELKAAEFQGTFVASREFSSCRKESP